MSAGKSSSVVRANAEYRIKAAFLYNAVRYTVWPEKALGGKEDKLVICVVGSDPFGKLLDQAFKDKTAHDREFVVKRVKSAAELKPCHVLFLGKLSDKEQERTIQWALKRPVLTVGEDSGLLDEGVCLNLLLKKGLVKFEANLDSVRASGLSLKSSFLKLARRFIGDRNGTRHGAEKHTKRDNEGEKSVKQEEKKYVGERR